jgi:hypothetical protein
LYSSWDDVAPKRESLKNLIRATSHDAAEVAARSR